MRQTDDGPEMPDSSIEFDQLIEVARLALGRGDRSGATGALTAAIEMTDGDDTLALQRADALMRLGALKQESGNPAEAEGFLREALEVSEAALGSDDVGLVPALTSLGTVLIARGAPEEAGPILTRALSISESHLGADHPDLVVLLNDLSRLYLKRSAFAFAAPLLTRLLAIKRAKGDEHPEVATVLASLGTVRQGLGDHDGAEQLFRRALSIREKTLAPNHFAIATTLEHLADTCAARGKYTEALRIYQRALPMRVTTLGAAHASVRVARERIADLQLQASEEPAELPVESDATPAPSLMTQALQAPPHVNPARPIQRRTPSPGRAMTPVPAKERVKTPPAPVLTALPTPVPVATPPAIQELERQPPQNVAQLDEAFRREAVAIPWSDRLQSVELELKEIDRRHTPAARALSAVGSANIAMQKRPARTAVVIAGAVALLLAALAVRARYWGEPDQRIFAEPAPVRSAPVMDVRLPALDSVTLAARPSETEDVPVSTPADAGRTTPAPRTVATEKSRERVAPPKLRPAETRTIAAPRFFGPIVGNIAMPGIDSAMRAASSPPRNLKDSFPTRFAGIGAVRPGIQDEVETGRGSSVPKLMGLAPVPRYPDDLRDRQVQGEVVVQFLVDDRGRVDVGTMLVLRSPHELLTNSVRNTLSQFRFEPARGPAPDARPRAEWVRFAFQFSAPRG